LLVDESLTTLSDVATRWGKLTKAQQKKIDETTKSMVQENGK
jgi:hypothetical protein